MLFRNKRSNCSIVSNDNGVAIINDTAGVPDIVSVRRRRYPLKGIHSRSDTNRTGAEGLSFY